VQVLPQAIPAGELVTVPLPDFETVIGLRKRVLAAFARVPTRFAW